MHTVFPKWLKDFRQCVKLKTNSELSIQFSVEDDIEFQFCSAFWESSNSDFWNIFVIPSIK